MRLIVATLTALSLIGLIILSNYWLPINDIEDCAKPAKTGKCQSVGAIVAISGGDTIGRTDQAVKLYKAGWSERLILSGKADDKFSPSNASVMKERALRLGVPSSAITIDEKADNTVQNAENVAKILEQSNIKRIILVTSPYHQRRAYNNFKKYCKGVKIINYSNQNDRDWPAYWWATWNGWRFAVSELSKNFINSWIL